MIADILAAAGTVLAGLGAGIFLSFTAGVMPGLRRARDASFVDGMRGINLGVVNAAFLGPIFLAPLVLAGATVAAFATGAEASRAWLLVAATVLQFAGSIVITGAWNIPLNNALAASADSDPDARAAFETPWTRGNLARTLLTVAGFLLAVLALVA